MLLLSCAAPSIAPSENTNNYSGACNAMKNREEVVKAQNPVQSLEDACERIRENADGTFVKLEFNSQNDGIVSIGDAGAVALAFALKNNTILKELHLGKTSIGVSGVTKLASCLRNSNWTVERLYLQDNPLIGDKGTEAIATIFSSNKSLRLLNLARCNVSDIGACALVEALTTNTAQDTSTTTETGIVEQCNSSSSFPSGLQKLYLYGNKITKIGAAAIAELIMCPNLLQELFLWDNPFGDSGMEDLETAYQHNGTLEGIKLHMKIDWNISLQKKSAEDKDKQPLKRVLAPLPDFLLALDKSTTASETLCQSPKRPVSESVFLKPKTQSKKKSVQNSPMILGKLGNNGFKNDVMMTPKKTLLNRNSSLNDKQHSLSSPRVSKSQSASASHNGLITTPKRYQKAYTPTSKDPRLGTVHNKMTEKPLPILKSFATPRSDKMRNFSQEKSKVLTLEKKSRTGTNTGKCASIKKVSSFDAYNESTREVCDTLSSFAKPERNNGTKILLSNLNSGPRVNDKNRNAGISKLLIDKATDVQNSVCIAEISIREDESKILFPDTKEDCIISSSVDVSNSSASHLSMSTPATCQNMQHNNLPQSSSLDSAAIVAKAKGHEKDTVFTTKNLQRHYSRGSSERHLMENKINTAGSIRVFPALQKSASSRSLSIKKTDEDSSYSHPLYESKRLWNGNPNHKYATSVNKNSSVDSQAVQTAELVGKTRKIFQRTFSCNTLTHIDNEPISNVPNQKDVVDLVNALSVTESFTTTYKIKVNKSPKQSSDHSQLTSVNSYTRNIQNSQTTLDDNKRNNSKVPANEGKRTNHLLQKSHSCKTLGTVIFPNKPSIKEIELPKTFKRDFDISNILQKRSSNLPITHENARLDTGICQSPKSSSLIQRGSLQKSFSCRSIKTLTDNFEKYNIANNQRSSNDNVVLRKNLKVKQDSIIADEEVMNSTTPSDTDGSIIPSIESQSNMRIARMGSTIKSYKEYQKIENNRTIKSDSSQIKSFNVSDVAKPNKIYSNSSSNTQVARSLDVDQTTLAHCTPIVYNHNNITINNVLNSEMKAADEILDEKLFSNLETNSVDDHLGNLNDYDGTTLLSEADIQNEKANLFQSQSNSDVESNLNSLILESKAKKLITNDFNMATKDNRDCRNTSKSTFLRKAFSAINDKDQQINSNRKKSESAPQSTHRSIRSLSSVEGCLHECISSNVPITTVENKLSGHPNVCKTDINVQKTLFQVQLKKAIENNEIRQETGSSHAKIIVQTTKECDRPIKMSSDIDNLDKKKDDNSISLVGPSTKLFRLCHNVSSGKNDSDLKNGNPASELEPPQNFSQKDIGSSCILSQPIDLQSSKQENNCIDDTQSQLPPTVASINLNNECCKDRKQMFAQLRAQAESFSKSNQKRQNIFAVKEIQSISLKQSKTSTINSCTSPTSCNTMKIAQDDLDSNEEDNALQLNRLASDGNVDHDMFTASKLMSVEEDEVTDLGQGMMNTTLSFVDPTDKDKLSSNLVTLPPVLPKSCTSRTSQYDDKHVDRPIDFNGDRKAVFAQLKAKAEATSKRKSDQSRPKPFTQINNENKMSQLKAPQNISESSRNILDRTTEEKYMLTTKSIIQNNTLPINDDRSIIPYNKIKGTSSSVEDFDSKPKVKIHEKELGYSDTIQSSAMALKSYHNEPKSETAMTQLSTSPAQLIPLQSTEQDGNATKTIETKILCDGNISKRVNGTVDQSQSFCQDMVDAHSTSPIRDNDFHGKSSVQPLLTVKEKIAQMKLTPTTHQRKPQYTSCSSNDFGIRKSYSIDDSDLSPKSTCRFSHNLDNPTMKSKSFDSSELSNSRYTILKAKKRQIEAKSAFLVPKDRVNRPQITKSLEDYETEESLSSGIDTNLRRKDSIRQNFGEIVCSDSHQQSNNNSCTNQFMDKELKKVSNTSTSVTDSKLIVSTNSSVPRMMRLNKWMKGSISSSSSPPPPLVRKPNPVSPSVTQQDEGERRRSTLRMKVHALELKASMNFSTPTT